MAGKFKVFWTGEAKHQVDQIVEFLIDRWSKKEAFEFLDLIAHFENTISHFPNSFKESSRFNDCRLGLIHKNVSAIYEFDGKTITILTVFDNRSDKER